MKTVCLGSAVVLGVAVFLVGKVVPTTPAPNQPAIIVASPAPRPDQRELQDASSQRNLRGDRAGVEVSLNPATPVSAQAPAQVAPVVQAPARPAFAVAQSQPSEDASLIESVVEPVTPEPQPTAPEESAQLRTPVPTPPLADSKPNNDPTSNNGLAKGKNKLKVTFGAPIDSGSES